MSATQSIRVLIAEDVATDAELSVRELKRAGLRLEHRVTDDEAGYRALLADFAPDVILSDFSMPHFDGMWALALARELVPDVPFIFVSGTIGEEYAIRALKNGATDYVLKNNLVRLPAAVERALQDRAEREARRKTERELEETRSRLDSIVTSLSDVVWSFSLRENRMLYMSSAARNMYRQPVNTFYARPMAWMDAIHPEDRERVVQEWNASIAARRFDSTYRIVLPDGEELWIHNRGGVITDERDEPVRIDGLARDITKRKRDEEALRKSESRLDLALQASGLATWEWNLATGEVRFSRHWWPILGYGSDEVLLRVEAWEKLTHPDDFPNVKSMLASAVKGSDPILDVEYRMRAKSGEWCWIRTVGQVVERDATGRASRMTGTHGDVTERKRAEEKIRRLNRVYAVLSGINSAIVRIRDRQKLFDEACRIAVEHGNFGIAWIGALDPAAQEVTPVAWAGFGAGDYLGGVKARLSDDLPSGPGILARALNTRKPVFDNDITINPEIGGARRQEAIRRGYRSVIVLPLIVEVSVVGSLSLIAKEANFFDEEELRLLTELAGDVSFALEHIAGQERIEKLSRVRAVSSSINAAIVRIRERQALFEETCRIASEEGKFEMVWIGTVDAEQQKIEPVTWTGFSEAAARAVSWASISAVQGTLGEATRTRRPAVRNDIETGLTTGKLRQEALQRGCLSTVCLPLTVGERVSALIVLFAPGRGFFDEDELALFEEVAADVSFALDHIEKEEQLNYLAYYEALTGLPNRTLFNDRLGQRIGAARDEQQSFSVMMVNLERFRLINDTFGRRAGDELLLGISRRLKGVLHSADLLAHFGGDQFAIATHRAGEPGVIAHVLEQVVTSISKEPFSAGSGELHLAAKAGVAVYPSDGADVEALVRNAEAALNDARKTGQRYVFYAPQMNVRVAGQLKLENELRRAVREEQFILHYQPRFDLAGGRITGLEALIRWRHPERGLVLPGEFIPLLEDTGLILEAGRWALKRAALDHAAWHGAGRQPPRIAVNVSLAQLRRRDFADYVKDALSGIDDAAARIDIEITESMLMEDIEGCIEKLKTVRSFGHSIAVDDFGTGYSSLSYLARLPINSLKIDRSFVTQMPKGPEQMAIVSTVISLARALNFKVVAEGVETEEQANLLRLLRCDEAQGYLFGKPMPFEKLEALLRAG
ncbi:MAG: EAL domain-containing protein [Betaproteobacteria bacterium]|nr:EAL domain-containing protein [Betaproteobacteria bacterium]